MIVYRDILKRLKEAGYNQTRLREEGLIAQSIINRLRNGEPISMSTLNTLCRLLSCQPGDILEYIPDNEKAEP